jgi:hypothetical protein
VFWGRRYGSPTLILREGLSTLPKLQPVLRQTPSSTPSNSCAGESCAPNGYGPLTIHKSIEFSLMRVTY